MAEITLVAEPGRATGTPESKRLRAAGRIPGVVYGAGGSATSVSVDARELRIALSGAAGSNQLLDLRVGGDRHLTMARVIQRHPVRHTVLHVDFQIVSRTETISVEVPVVLTGEAKAVESDQGVVEQQLTALTVSSRPGDIPNELIVDISGLRVGDSIRVGQLRLPDGVTTDVDPDDAVVIATGSSTTAELAEIEVAEAEADAAEAAAEGGDPVAAGGDEADAGGADAAGQQ
ncbi:MAG TPA: 50S ribosomal protein L25 [Acidimicrobiales bacterium]|nr:50S ribosomal protein L25 [Acidimicrobiales bacterium]